MDFDVLFQTQLDALKEEGELSRFCRIGTQVWCIPTRSLSRYRGP